MISPLISLLNKGNIVIYKKNTNNDNSNKESDSNNGVDNDNVSKSFSVMIICT